MNCHIILLKVIFKCIDPIQDVCVKIWVSLVDQVNPMGQDNMSKTLVDSKMYIILTVSPIFRLKFGGPKKYMVYEEV